MLFKNILLLICMAFFANIAVAQKSDSTKEKQVENLLNNHEYIFIANYANPMSGRMRTLTSEYSLQVQKDTVTAYLPYFGTVTTPSMQLLNGEGGIKFTSTKFNYTMTTGKKSRKDIQIKINDSGDARQLTLTVFSNGSASLNVISSGRQPVSYRGYIEAIKK